MRFSIALILAVAPTVWAADPVPMNIKTGQWEMTMSSQVSGMQGTRQMPQIPADKLAQLPPAQRAQIEAALARAATGGAAPTVYKSCITKESLSQMQASRDSAAANCKNTVLSSSATKQVVQSDCTIAGTRRLSTATFEALGEDSVKFTIVSNPDPASAAASSPAASATVNISGTSKWLGPVCTESK